MSEKRMGVNLARREAKVMEREGRSNVGMRKRYMPMKTFGGVERRMDVCGGWGAEARRWRVAWVDIPGVGWSLVCWGDELVCLTYEKSKNPKTNW